MFHREYVGVASALLLVGVSWFIYRFPDSEHLNQPGEENLTPLTEGVLRDLSKRIHPSQSASVLFTQGGPLVPEYIQMMLESEKKILLFGSAALTPTLNEVINSLNRYKFVILQDRDLLGKPDFAMPAEIWEGDLKAYLDNHHEWSLIGTYLSSDRKHVYLYGRLEH